MDFTKEKMYIHKARNSELGASSWMTVFAYVYMYSFYVHELLEITK